MTPNVPVDGGLLARLERAYATIAWEAAGPPRPARGRKARLARLHDETARVETWETEGGAGIAVTSGPVGALVLLVEIERRGSVRALGALNANRVPGFPDGSIVASWGSEEVVFDSRPELRDLVELARYALP